MRYIATVLRTTRNQIEIEAPNSQVAWDAAGDLVHGPTDIEELVIGSWDVVEEDVGDVEEASA